MKRYAIVRGARGLSEAQAYLPDNYRVIFTTTEAVVDGRTDLTPSGRETRPAFVIDGEDAYGWTLDDYVIPRYLSGLIGCEEIDLSHPVMGKVPA